MSTMRAKFRVSSVEKFDGSEKLTFVAVGKSDGYPADGSDENNTFARWTPTATCEVYVNNPALHGKFEPGQEYYVDFTPAAAPAGGA